MDIWALLNYGFMGIAAALSLLPGTEADPRELALLQNAQQQVAGENGADALYRLKELGAVWPEKIPVCERGRTDCLALAREQHEHWARLPEKDYATWQAVDEYIAALGQYGHFRYPFFMETDTPHLAVLMQNNRLHAYRFVDGAPQAALDATCRDAQLALTFINSQNTLIDSMIGAALLRQSVMLIAEMLAEVPTLSLSPACDGVQTLPGETLAICPLLLGEWRTQENSLRQEMAKLPPTDIVLAAWYRQFLANLTYEYSRYCEPDIIAGIARGELAMPPLENGMPKHCSPLNALCHIAQPGFVRSQKMLLNSNRYLAAFDALRDAQAPLAQGIRREQGRLVFTRFAERAEEGEAMVEMVLPLPGSRVKP